MRSVSLPRPRTGYPKPSQALDFPYSTRLTQFKVNHRTAEPKDAMLSDLLTVDIVSFFLNEFLRFCVRVIIRDEHQRRQREEETELLMRLNRLVQTLPVQIHHTTLLVESTLATVIKSKEEGRRIAICDCDKQELEKVVVVLAELKEWQHTASWILDSREARSQKAGSLRPWLENAVLDGEALAASLKTLEKLRTEEFPISMLP